MNQTLYGYAVIIQPDRPKMVLSEDVPVSDDFRIEINEWMRGFFGTSNWIPDGEVYKMETIRQLHMNPRTYEMLKEKFRDAGVTT